MASKTYDLSAQEVADQLRVNVETVKRWAREGRVPARKNMSGFWRFCRTDVKKLPVRSVTERVRSR